MRFMCHMQHVPSPASLLWQLSYALHPLYLVLKDGARALLRRKIYVFQLQRAVMLISSGRTYYDDVSSGPP